MKTARRTDFLGMLMAAALFGLAGCAAPTGNGSAKAEPVSTAPAVSPTPAPRDVAAAITAPTASKAAPAGVVDFSCKTDADCTVKNVGNCCGAYPRCVNVDSPTLPEQVKAACAANGQMGVCGFPSIAGCQCVAGTCAATEGPSAAKRTD